jgi:pimeloyl-ACP methyl ester carboxylesterase
MRTEAVFDHDDFEQIECPVLAIYGTQSDLDWVPDRMRELIRDVTTHTLAGADHLGVYRRVDEVRPLIRRFIGLPVTS